MITVGGITIRLTPEERATIEKAAKARHLPVSTWLRQLVLKAFVAERDEAELRAKRKASWAELREMLWNLPAAHEHADEVERLRRNGWRKSWS